MRDSRRVVVASPSLLPRQFRATATPRSAFDRTLGTASLHRPTSAFTIFATDAGSPASDSRCRCSRMDKDSSAASTRNPTRSHRSSCSRKLVKRSNKPSLSLKRSGLICSVVAASTIIFTTVSAPTCRHSARSGVRTQMCCSSARAGSESSRGIVSGGGGGMLLALGSSVALVGGARTSSSCPARSTGRSRKTLVEKSKRPGMPRHGVLRDGGVARVLLRQCQRGHHRLEDLGRQYVLFPVQLQHHIEQTHRGGLPGRLVHRGEHDISEQVHEGTVGQLLPPETDLRGKALQSREHLLQAPGIRLRAHHLLIFLDVTHFSLVDQRLQRFGNLSHHHRHKHPVRLRPLRRQQRNIAQSRRGRPVPPVAEDLSQHRRQGLVHG
mmetsp:Transcript_53720/g.142863  ORF Transcript_53720/g.142863 Transcript_53720/m.142863 type:complete len:381 (-) Transcript_53720:349-1491(-)